MKTKVEEDGKAAEVKKEEEEGRGKKMKMRREVVLALD